MIRRLIAATPRELVKCCAYALILLTPGSFVVLPLLWLIRQFGVRTVPRRRDRTGVALQASAKNAAV
jgi:hypothetical protein